MAIDLHTHSSRSDGTDTPSELMAAAAGLDVVAITDHDTTAGWSEAAAARPAHVALVRGAEFSTHLAAAGRRISVHLLGYLFDPAAPAIVAEQARLREERMHRGLTMVQLMVADGVPISATQVLEIAAGAPIGRPHIGRALVAAGLVGTVTDAFATYLSGRGPYFVPKADTELPAAIELVLAAGGVCVIAHPRSRGAARVLDEARLEGLAGAGLTGLEVDHPDHDAASRAELRAIAARLHLVPTGSSDYHGGNKEIRIGQESTSPEALVALVAASSGVTSVLGPAA